MTHDRPPQNVPENDRNSAIFTAITTIPAKLNGRKLPEITGNYRKLKFSPFQPLPQEIYKEDEER